MGAVRQGLFQFPGIDQIIAADFPFAGHGITPSVAVIEMVPQQSISQIDGDLTITFDDLVLVIPDCRLNRSSFQYNERGLINRLELCDKRWRWRYGEAI